ncbi:MAG TPA: hypothetical protein VG053_02245 [Solirubrobacteraceae bacterium]|jgi:hypothetical protein|nr:hypothetical protein [Solirubrobacteraceae bacterium]
MEMNRMGITGRCLVAVFAFSAVAVASASATEVLFKLEKGSFPATFASEGGKSKLTTTAGSEIECQSVVGKGTIGSSTEGGGTTAHLGTAEVKFKGCRSISPSAECKSHGANAEEVVIPSGEFHLGLLVPGAEAEKPAILSLLPGASVSNPLGGSLTFKCSLASVEVKGDVVGKLEGPIEKFESETKIVFEQSGGVQKFKEFLLSLTSPENELMTGQHLTIKSTLFTTEEAEFAVTSTGTSKEFKNSAGESTKIGLVKG